MTLCTFNNATGNGDGNDPANWKDGRMPVHDGDSMHIVADMKEPLVIPLDVVLHSIIVEEGVRVCYGDGRQRERTITGNGTLPRVHDHE